MAFCIECGAKAPDVAKFCPQCGVALVPVEPEKEVDAKAKKAVVADKIVAKAEAKPAPKPEAKIAPQPKTTPDAQDKAASLDVTPDGVEAPKSKAGLLIGLGLIALVIAGGGSYAAGLFGGDDDTSQQATTKPMIEAPATDTPAQDDTTETTTVLAAYQEAIRTGRISDLGQFALDNPAHSLAQDAKDAAFASLQRQSSELAFSTFIKYFPEADLSQYLGPRPGDETQTVISPDQAMIETQPMIEVDAPTSVSTFEIPTIRTSISTRVDDLSPFIQQGNIDYALSVIDEMLSYPDLTEDEATYLLNIRSRTETTQGLATSEIPADTVVIEPVATTPSSVEVQMPAADVTPAPVVIAPSIEDVETPAPEVEAEANLPVIEAKPTPTFDTPAKPIERFGAITPDAATEPGECDMSFGVDVSGKPINVSATCTNAIFIAPAVETVGEWSYEPATLAGVPVVQEGLSVKIRFHLDDPI